MCCNVQQLASVSNHSLNCGLHDWSQPSHGGKKKEKPTGYKFRGLEAEMRLNMVIGWVCVLLSSLWLCVCVCVCITSCRAVRLLFSWCGEGGLLWQANHDQLGSPAHKEFKSRRLQPVCICRLLTSHLIALTHQLLLLRAGVIYLYTRRSRTAYHLKVSGSPHLPLIYTQAFIGRFKNGVFPTAMSS